MDTIIWILEFLVCLFVNAEGASIFTGKDELFYLISTKINEKDIGSQNSIGVAGKEREGQRHGRIQRDRQHLRRSRTVEEAEAVVRGEHRCSHRSI